jgi:hypothetical protein
MRSGKMAAAAKAARELDADQAQSRMGKKFVPKMRAARLFQAQRYDEMRDRFRDSGLHRDIAAVCKIDRVVLAVDTDSFPWEQIRALPGWVARKERRLWEKAYRFALPIDGTGSIREIVIEHKRAASWFPRFRITVCPHDETGLQFEDLRLLLELLPNFELRLLEIALDFPVHCGIDLEFIRRFGLFGKTRLEGWSRYHAKWGHWGSKIVRAYMKWRIFQFRVELELHVALLRRLGISDFFDFAKLAEALVPHHVSFGQLSDAKVAIAARLRGMSKIEAEMVRRRTMRIAESSLWEALCYLRGARLKNVRRLLIENREMNRAIREALDKTLKRWPTSGTFLKVKP